MRMKKRITILEAQVEMLLHHVFLNDKPSMPPALELVSFTNSKSRKKALKIVNKKTKEIPLPPEKPKKTKKV